MVIYQVTMSIIQVRYTKLDVVCLLAKAFVTNTERTEMPIRRS
jgi:hypothetical protein